MYLHQVLKVPVQAQGSTLVGNTSHIVTSRMTRKIIGRQAILPLSLASLGVSFLIEGGVAVADVEGTIPVISPDRPVNSHINDNYCLVDPQLNLSVEDPVCQDLNKSVIKTVNLDVVCHAPCVTGLSENKDIRPNQAHREIKCVKPVCSVNHCFCAPNVPNVPHVVANPPVGARLQSFGRSGTPWVQTQE